jgi:hypothetical protein
VQQQVACLATSWGKNAVSVRPEKIRAIMAVIRDFLVILVSMVVEA